MPHEAPVSCPSIWAMNMVQTLQRVDEEDKCSLTELIRRKGMPPRGGMLNIPPPSPEVHTPWWHAFAPRGRHEA